MELRLTIHRDTDADDPRGWDCEVSPETLQQWSAGDVWGFELENVEACPHCDQEIRTFVDSCWGFYDRDTVADHLEGDALALLPAAWNARP